LVPIARFIKKKSCGHFFLFAAHSLAVCRFVPVLRGDAVEMHIIAQFLKTELQQNVFVEITYRKCDVKRKRGKLWICGRRINGTDGSGDDGNISELG